MAVPALGLYFEREGWAPRRVANLLYAASAAEPLCTHVKDHRFSALSPCVPTLGSTAPASKIKGLAHRAARRVGRPIFPRKMMEIDSKIDAMSIEVGRAGHVEAPNAIEVGRSGPVEAPKSIKVDRSSPGRSSWHHRCKLEQACGCEAGYRCRTCDASSSIG